MKTGFKKTLQRIILGCGLVTGGLNSGCDSSGNLYQSTQYTAGGLGMQHIAQTSPNLTPKQANAFGLVGALLQEVGRQESIREAAREIKNQRYGINSRPDFKHTLNLIGLEEVFLCTTYNENGRGPFEKFQGIKDIFYEYEDCYVASIWDNRDGSLKNKKVRLEVWRNDTNEGKVANPEGSSISFNGKGFSYNWFKLNLKALKKDFGEGGMKYTAILSIDNAPILHKEFIVLRSPEKFSNLEDEANK